MKKILLVIARYKDNEQQIYNKHLSPRNKEYAAKHGYEYVEIDNATELELVRGNPTWWKFSILREWISTGKLTDGDIILHLDADMYITDISNDLATSKSFTYAIDSGNTHCMGWYSLKINDWSKQMLEHLFSEERMEMLKDYPHPKGGKFWSIFREQASWYSLAGVTPHSDTPYLQIPHFGWLSDFGQSPVYSHEELYENVEIRDHRFNVTEWPGESNCVYNINKLRDRDQVIIRHFVSGQLWNNELLINNWKK